MQAPLFADPARVNFTPAFQYMPLNLSGTVRCYIQANPPIQFVTWFKDNRPFEASSVNGVVNLSNGSLFFQRVSYEHQGRYLCSPFNIHSTGGSSAVMEVLVRGTCHALLSQSTFFVSFAIVT